MASSNRHWPSMFKSKPCNNHHHHQWQHDINPSSLISSSCHRSSGCEERTPEPKPRWNPKPEQIRILEAIFNSGMVNPPRDEIRKIRAQLQEYGQVGDANVFYWFQNRKSRSKFKLRNLQNTKQKHQTTTTTAPSSSPSSSSDISSPNSGSYSFHQAQNEFSNEPFCFPVQQATGGPGFTQGFGCFSEMVNNNGVQVPEQQQVGPCTSLLFSEILNHGGSRKEHDEKMMMQLQLSYTMTNSDHSIHTSPPPTATTTVPSHTIHGVGESGAVEPGGAAKSSSSSSSSSTVFINDVAFEVGVGPFNVREAFGDDAMLINSAGQTVVTNEWGSTLQSLQHGGFYYLLRSSTPFYE